MKKLVIIVICVISAFGAKAAHIVGGELFYDCLGNNQYRITLKLYRDCFCAPPCAGYGDPEYLGIFTSTGVLYDQPGMPFPGSLELSSSITNTCLIPPSICVEEAVYSTIVTLPPTAGGYDVVYQRCCRNSGVANVVSGIGQEQGATYMVHIPGSAQATCNNSPRFANFPPIFICNNAPLVFDHSATDADGDQLVYSLCDPFSGADENCPNPVPATALPPPPPGCPNQPSSPPYSPVMYTGSYSSGNFLNSPSNSGNIKIDANTGLLTCTPNTVGMFAVAVCVSEFRNGVLLGSVRRDFQFNVTQCNIPIANIPSSNINPSTGVGIYIQNCADYTVVFQNHTYNPPPSNVPLTYHWDFGVQGITTDTSSLQYPTYIYPDTGTFLVKLVAVKDANSSQPCTDTTYAYVKIYPNLITNFTPADICQNVAANFIDGSVSTYNDINQWSWTFGDGGASNLKNPSHNYTAPGTYAVTLSNQTALGCKDTIQKTITVFDAPSANYTYGPTCIDAPVSFTYSGSSNVVSYNWSFGTGATSTQQNPSYTYNPTGNYTVSVVVESNNGCRDTATQILQVHPLPIINVSNDSTICPFTSMQLSASGGVTYVWTPAAGLNDDSIANPLATPTPPASITYTVHVTDQFQCQNTDSVRISFTPIFPVDAGPDTSVCLNPGSFRDSVQLNATGVVSYLWSPATGLTSTTIPNPVSRPQVNTTYTVLGTDINGCKTTDSVSVYFLDPALNIIIDDSKIICERDTAYINAINQGASNYSWSPNQYLTATNIYNPGFFPPDTANYILTISNYCYTKNDSVLILVQPLPRLNLNPLDSVCIHESAQLQANDAQTYHWNADPTLSDTTIANPIATPITNTWYYVTGTSQYGCVNRDSTLILVYFPSAIQIQPQVPYVCLGTPVPLLVTGAYTYQWNAEPTLSATNIANPVANPTDTTQYVVEATNIHGCKTYDSVTLNVQFPVTAVTASPFDACRGVPLQLFASGGFYYHWTPEAGLNNPFTDKPFAMPDSSTSYIIEVSNDCFNDTAVAEVIVHQLPDVDAGPDTLIWRDTYVVLHGTTPETNHFWNPSTWLDDPYDLVTNAQPQQTTWYELFAIDQYGCLNIDSVLITVEPHTILLLPTAFSPNNDGMNDVFRIARWLNIEKLKEFAIYDRWGNLVFRTTNIEEGWDGRYKNQPADMGVFAWVVVAAVKDGGDVVHKGNVTLVR